MHCGVAVGNEKEVAEKKVNAFGIAGFVVSLVSLYLGIYFCIGSVVGLALSIVGMVQAKKCRLNGFAIAGLVLGIISLLVWAIVWLTVGAVIIGLGATAL